MIEPAEVIAARALARASKGRSLKGFMDKEFRKRRVPESARAVVTALAFNTARRWRFLRYLLNERHSTPPGTVKGWLRLVVAFQGAFRKRPWELVESVARTSGIGEDFYRDLLRLDVESELRRVEEPIRYSVPDWVWKELILTLGGEAESFVRTGDQRDWIWVRVRDPDKVREVARKLEEMGLVVGFDEIPFALKLKGPIRKVINSKLVPREIVIMEKASMIPPLYCDGETLDATAAPGGKTLELVDLGKFAVGLDIKPNRFVYKEVERVGGDLRRPPFRKSFDTVYLDPDCTGIGRIGVAPETRIWLVWTRKESFVRYQRELIMAGAKLAKRKVVYSTCTITYDENEGHSQLLEELGFEPCCDYKYGTRGFKDGWIRLYPHKHETVGFGIGCWCKR